MAQTLMEILSGISTATRAIMDAAHKANPACRVACTRKHMPGIKRWALRAIEAGGAAPHRLGLSDTILVFEDQRIVISAIADAASAGKNTCAVGCGIGDQRFHGLDPAVIGERSHLSRGVESIADLHRAGNDSVPWKAGNGGRKSLSDR